MSSMRKRGQSHTQVVMYAMIIVIIGLTVIWGYKAYKSSREKAQDTEIEIFNQKLQADFSSLKTRFGSVKTQKYDIPGVVDKVCFLDFSHKDDAKKSPVVNKYSLIVSAIESDAKKNLFIIQKEEIITSFDIEDIMLSDYPYFMCMDTMLSSLNIDLEGKAKGTLVRKDFKTTASNSNKIVSHDGSITLEFSSPQTLSMQPEYPSTIEKPTSELGGEAYKFIPSGMAAIRMTIIYDPLIIGNSCPSSLRFIWYKADGTYEGESSSSQVTCSEKKAVFNDIIVKPYGHLAKA